MDGQEILRIPAWKKSFELVKRELEATLEKETHLSSQQSEPFLSSQLLGTILLGTIPEFPTVRRMTLGMNSFLVVPSVFARATVERQQKEFTDG